MRWLKSILEHLKHTGMQGAYRRYVAHLAHHHPEEAPLSYEAFYLQEQQRRWNGGPRRCC